MGYMAGESKRPTTDEELKARSLARWENEGGAKRAMSKHHPIAPVCDDGVPGINQVRPSACLSSDPRSPHAP